MLQMSISSSLHGSRCSSYSKSIVDVIILLFWRVISPIWCVLKKITYRRGLKEKAGELCLPGIFRIAGFHINALPVTCAVHNNSAALDARTEKPLLDREVSDPCKQVNYSNSYVL